MNPPEHTSTEPTSPVPLIISILGAILSILPFDKLVSLAAGIGAIIAAVFSVRNSYYSTKLSKKKLEENDNEKLDSE